MLEIIVTGRHDDYGGDDFLDRLCAAASHNHRLLTGCGVPHGFTFVEWNPVAGQALLADLIRDRLPWWHQFLIVDREWHQALSTNPHLPFMEFFAKNAAIRRSRADIILTTNSDVFLSTEAATVLANRKQWDDRVVYRAVRIDIDRRVEWRTCGEDVFTDPSRQLRVNNLEPPYYGNSAGDFLLLTRAAWMALGGFNERVRFARVHKDEQFCVNAQREGYTFETIGPIYHIDHDGSYANGGPMRGSPTARYGPEWDYFTRYRNPASWGLSAGVEEHAANGYVHVRHPSTHGPLLSVIVPTGDEVASAVNAALVTTRGQFVVVTTDPTLAAFGGHDALVEVLEKTTAGLILPHGSLVEHPQLGLLLAAGAPYVMRRHVIDAFIEWDTTAADPALAFWLHAVDIATIETMAPAAAHGSTHAASPWASPVSASLQVSTLTRRGAVVPTELVEAALRDHLTQGREVQGLLGQWLDAVAPDRSTLCAIVGPDWATPTLIELLHAQQRPVAGFFTALANEEGSWRWGQRLRPLSELAYAMPAHVFAGADPRVRERLAAMGCTAAVHVISGVDDPDRTAADAELDVLRRAQARDVAQGNVSALMERLPLLSMLEGDHKWTHRYDAAQACEKGGRAATALELFQEIVADCSTDLSLQMRAAFHTARLLVARGATYQATPLLKKILKHNPAHRAARALLDEISAPMVPAGVGK
jgi:hypothetical protein